MLRGDDQASDWGWLATYMVGGMPDMVRVRHACLWHGFGIGGKEHV